VITSERGRELLATPRAGQEGATPTPAADEDPPGLAWLAEGKAGDFLSVYRFLLVAEVEPVDLPARIGAAEGAALDEPATMWDARTRPQGHRSGELWADEALTAVGRAGPGWSFAFEARPSVGFDERRLVSPGIDASVGARAVTVWSEPFDGRRSGFFHLSVAENGAERYGLTVRETSVDRRGPLPSSLDPDLLFPLGVPRQDRTGERRALEALAVEFGVRLPRFALTHGRLHTLRTRSWSRPPAPGEGHVALLVGPVGMDLPPRHG
jgi:hypothetical protein